jgi:hypothetical protein
VSDPDPIAFALGAIYDDAALLAPAGATLRASFVDKGAILALEKLEFDVMPDSEQAPPLSYNPNARLADLGTAATSLRFLLKKGGVTWSTPRFEVAPEELRLFSGDSLVRTFPVDRSRSTMTPSLFALLDEHKSALAKLRGESIRLAGQFKGARIEMPHLHVQFDEARSVPLDLLAGYGREKSTLVWAWAGPDGDRPDRPSIRKVRELTANVNAFQFENIFAEPELATCLVELAATIAGASAILPLGSAEALRFFAI